MISQEEILKSCQKLIGYRFDDTKLLKAALTHSSGADTYLASNERLEFLGDAVLGFVICEMLCNRFPELTEGEMTKIKSAVVSRVSCLNIAKELELEDYMFLGRGVGSSAGRKKISSSILSNVVEALIAAIYLDGGMRAAKKFITKYFDPLIAHYAESVEADNFKSLLQQVAQRDFGQTPEYKVIEVKGPDHSKCFRISVKIGKTLFQSAWGNNKKEAEQRAAENALYILRGEEAPYFGAE
ncbi:MAG: ribonuclease III [Thermoguttaceae bacterium]